MAFKEMVQSEMKTYDRPEYFQHLTPIVSKMLELFDTSFHFHILQQNTQGPASEYPEPSLFTRNLSVFVGIQRN